MSKRRQVAETLADNDRRRALLKCTTWVKVDARLTHTYVGVYASVTGRSHFASHMHKRVHSVRERPWIALGVGLHWEVVEFPPASANPRHEEKVCGKKHGTKFSAPKPPTNFLLARVCLESPICDQYLSVASRIQKIHCTAASYDIVLFSNPQK